MIYPNSTYTNRCIKSSERSLRGDSDRFVIRSGVVRIPVDFKTFLTNGDNKERMFEVIEEVWKENSGKIGERIVYFARGGTCTMITRTTTVDIEDLATDHEEADTKIAYLIQHAANTNHDKDIVCVVRSNSGDIDIPIILLGIELERNVHVYTVLTMVLAKTEEF